MVVYNIICCGVPCSVGMQCSYIVLYKHVFRYYNDTIVLCSSKFLYQRQSVIIFTYVHNRHNPHRYLVQRRWPKAFSSFMTQVVQTFPRSHTAQAQSVSNNTSHPSYLPIYTPDTIHACLQFQRRWPKAFPTAVYLLPSHRTYNLVNIRGDQIITS